MKTIYYGGQVYTGELPLVEAFVVEDGRFRFTGSNADALAMAGSGDTLFDLHGRFVCCGFNDSHMHLLNYGQSLMSAHLSEHTQSLEELISYFRDFLAERPRKNGAWLVGRGWNHDYFHDVHRMPTRWDLDQVSTQVPVMAVRCCGHCLVVNSKVLELTGVTADTPCPEGGKIGMEGGEPNGCFFDNAMDLVYANVPVPTKEDLKDMIRLGCQGLNSYGVTSCQSDDYCVFRSIPWQTVVQAYEELEQAGELTVRVYEQENFTTVEALKEYVAAGYNTGVGSVNYKHGPLKILGDGSLGARTAFLSQPYADDPSTRGFPVFSQEAMAALVSYANSVGMQVAIHAIGDGCLDYVLHSVEQALREHSRKDHRHGVVHCQISRPDQLQKMIELGMHIYMQSIFLDYDNHIVRDRVGEKIAASSYAWKTLKRGGLSVSNGTDCPVEKPDALACIQCAVTRTTLHDNVGPYNPEEAFTVQEAIDSYTIRGAEASFEEGMKGLMKPGYLADFVILDKNLFEIGEDAIKDVQVCATFLGGRQVFSQNA